jgi:hypothetical protein
MLKKFNIYQHLSVVEAILLAAIEQPQTVENL